VPVTRSQANARMALLAVTWLTGLPVRKRRHRRARFGYLREALTGSSISSDCNMAGGVGIVAFTGPIACALSNLACRKGLSAIYRRASRFFRRARARALLPKEGHLTLTHPPGPRRFAPT
jgi:hypothetical protein